MIEYEPKVTFGNQPEVTENQIGKCSSNKHFRQL